MSAGGCSTRCGCGAVFCRAKNNGAITFNGSSNSMPSWTDAGGVGWIKSRRFRQAKVMRPRFKAGSIKFAGNKTWAFARFDCLISSRSPAGQFSESAAKGAEMAAGSTGICGAGEGAGMGATGFGAPLLRGVTKLVAGVGACGMYGGGGGVVALVAGVMAREANENDGGAVIRNGGKAVDGVGLAATEISTPSPPAPNGPVMSSATSTCFWAERRDSRAGFNRARISLSGSITGLWSCSPPELTNTPGAAFRNSPKAIFTEPNASCVRIFSSGTAIIIPAGGVCMTFARKSIGIAARIDCRGSCNSSGFFAGAGGSVDAGDVVCGRAAAAGATATGGVATASAHGVWGAVASPSARRRSSPRSIPVNFIFTLFVMALMLYRRRSAARLLCFSRKHAMVGFSSDLAVRTFESIERSVGRVENLSQRWTSLSLVCSHSGI